ncbi:hypothetical protein LZ016_13830 [Sphingomonas sp. SM33]|uniref:DUF2029 domain-containing protein n=1 Tax=Sphingomonas telluris TaxID=2907998 RepID=A0ABS9VQB8_9SPHN|nr:hypothetical protein [Sphingomonas telluris]MCH8617173.1 hypothetical protein [Sphingomonas telluris]
MEQKLAGRPTVRSPAIIVIAATIAVAYSIPLGFQHLDLHKFLLPWYRHIEQTGQIAAFAAPFGNYTPPYLYLLSLATLIPVDPLYAIKGISVFGALLLSASVYYLLSGIPRRDEAAISVLLLPTVVFNAAVLGQADAFWTASAVMSVAAALRGRLLAMVAWAGLSFALKAQAAFLAPFVIAVLVSRRAPLRYWLVPTLVYAMAMFPAWLAGWPAQDLATVYVRQMAWQPDSGARFVSNAANWWTVAWWLDVVPPLWVGGVLGVGGVTAYVYAFRRIERRQMLAAAAFSAALLPWLLPLMHERFHILADVLAFALAWALRTRLAVAAAVAMQTGSALAVVGYTAYYSIGMATVGCAFVILALAALARLSELQPGPNGAHETELAGRRCADSSLAKAGVS